MAYGGQKTRFSPYPFSLMDKKTKKQPSLKVMDLKIQETSFNN